MAWMKFGIEGGLVLWLFGSGLLPIGALATAGRLMVASMIPSTIERVQTFMDVASQSAVALPED